MLPFSSRPKSSALAGTLIAAVVTLAFLLALSAGTAEAARVAQCEGRAATMPLNARGNASGTKRADVIAGNRRANRIGGKGGADRLCGWGGRDRLAGGAGDDRISGGTGADRIRGGRGADRIRGDRGRDRISGGPGRDRILGGAGRDRIDAEDGTRDSIDCGPGRDVAYVDEIDRTRRCERVIPPPGLSAKMAGFSLPPWSDAQWSDPSAYGTVQTGDIDGDGADELVGRGPLGIEAYDFDPGTGQWLPLYSQPSPALTDDDGWDGPAYFKTIQLADIDGDGADELLARAADGLHVWRFVESSASWAALPTLTDLSDAAGWGSSPSYYETIQAGNVIGSAAEEVLARAGNGMRVWSFSGGSWHKLAGSGPLGDADGWDRPAYYTSINSDPGMIDAAGEHEVLWARGAGGIHFYGFTPSGWVKYDRVLTRFADDDRFGPWDDARAYSTLQAVINPYGDGASYVMGRSGSTFLAFSAYRSVPNKVTDDAFSWQGGWESPPYRSTIQAADVDGDGRDEVIGRAASGVVAFEFERLGNGPGSDGRLRRLAGTAGTFTDGAGWDRARYFSTIQTADVGLEGSNLLLGRGVSGVVSHRWGDGASTPSASFPVFSGDRAAAYTVISDALAGRGSDLRSAYSDWSAQSFTNARITLAALGAPAQVSPEAWAEVKAAIDAELQNGGLVADWFDNYLRPNVAQTFQIQGMDATTELLRLDTKSNLELQARQWALFTGIVNAAAKAGGAAAGPAGSVFSAVVGTVISTGIGAPDINGAMNTISARYIVLRDRLQGNFQSAIKGVGVARETINGDYGLQLAVADRLIRAGLWRKMNAEQTAATMAGAAKAYSIHTWQTLTPALWQVTQFASNQHSNELYCTMLSACLYDTDGAAWAPTTGTNKRGFGQLVTRGLRDQLFGATSEACKQAWQFSSCNLEVNPADLFRGRRGWGAVPVLVCDGTVSGRVRAETCTRRR